jgi:ferric-dicitrate binding protein FerR (iron transport regulator)
VTFGESDSPTLADVEAVVREHVSGHIDGDRHEQGKQRLLAALSRRRPSHTHLRKPLAAGAVLVLLAGLGTLAYRRHHDDRLAYEVTGGLLSESGYVRSSGSSGARLSFSDGTRVDLQDGARARIAAVDGHGARLAIENGHAALDVARLPNAAWYVDAGPFVIQVTGTQFDVDWSSYDDTLSVDLHEGTLVVSGPPAPSGVLLHAGQRLTAHEGRLSIEALESAVQPSLVDPPLADLSDPLLALPGPEAPPAEPLAPKTAAPR